MGGVSNALFGVFSDEVVEFIDDPLNTSDAASE